MSYEPGPPTASDDAWGWAALLFALFLGYLLWSVVTGEPGARQERANAEVERTMQEFKIKIENARIACDRGVQSACEEL